METTTNSTGIRLGEAFNGLCEWFGKFMMKAYGDEDNALSGEREKIIMITLLTRFSIMCQFWSS